MLQNEIVGRTQNIDGQVALVLRNPTYGSVAIVEFNSDGVGEIIKTITEFEKKLINKLERHLLPDELQTLTFLNDIMMTETGKIISVASVKSKVECPVAEDEEP